MSGESASGTTSGPGFVESHRELLFNLGVVLGMIVFSLGLTFLIVGLSMTTGPPAPSFSSTTDRLVVLGLSLGFIAAGALVVRGAMEFGRW